MNFFRKKKSKFSIFISNFLLNESEILNKRHKVCEGKNKLQNAKKRNVLPSKLRPVKMFPNFPKIYRKRNSKTMHPTKKSHE